MAARPVTLFLSKHKNIIISIFIFIITFAIYISTLLPTVGTGDVAKFQFIASNMGIPHTTGYPLYMLIAKLFSWLPIGDIAYRINLMSAFFASLTGSVIYFINLKVTKNLVASILGPFIFCFSLTLWSQAVIAEVYALNIFLISLIVFFLLDFADSKKPSRVYAAFTVFALALGNHMLVITVFPSMIAAILFTDLKFFKRTKNIIYTILPFFLTVALYAFLFLRARSHPIYNEGNIDSINSFFWFVSGGIFKGQFFQFEISGLFERFVMYLNILYNQFTIPVLVLGIAGLFIIAIRRTRIFILFLLVLLVNMIFMVNYNIFDIDVYIIPSVFIFSIFASYTAHFLIEAIKGMLLKQKGKGRILQYTSQYTKVIIPAVTSAVMVILFALSFYNFAYNFKANDQSKELDDYLRSKNIVSKVEDDAVIIPEDYFVSMSLLYYIWVEDKGNNIIVPFSFIANPYYVDLEYLENELGIKREPFRMTLAEINKYKTKNNIFIEDITKILQKRPVYILQKNKIIESKFNLGEITKQKFNFTQILKNIPEQNHVAIIIKYLDDAKKTELTGCLTKAGFETSYLESLGSGTNNMIIIAEGNEVIDSINLENYEEYDLKCIMKNLGIKIKSDIVFSLDDALKIKIDGNNRNIDSPVAILNIDSNFKISDLYAFNDFKGHFEIPYSYSNPQIFKVLSVKE